MHDSSNIRIELEVTQYAKHHFSLTIHLLRNLLQNFKERRMNWANLLYGGSFRRFIQVADVGNRSRASSDASPPAL